MLKANPKDSNVDRIASIMDDTAPSGSNCVEINQFYRHVIPSGLRKQRNLSKEKESEGFKWL